MFSITPEYRYLAMLALQDIPGVGSSLADRLSRTLGSEDAVIEALDRGDVASLTAVEGLSANRAIRLIKAARGSDPDICRSGEGEALHRRILESIAEGASTLLRRNASNSWAHILAQSENRLSLTEGELRRQWISS